MSYNTSNLKEPVSGETYTFQITSAKAKLAKKTKNLMLNLGLDIISGNALGAQIWHRLMLVDNAKNGASTAKWMAKSAREYQQITGYVPESLPTEEGEKVEAVEELVGKAFDAVVKWEDGTGDWGGSFKIARILGPVDPAEIQGGLDNAFDDNDEGIL